jgi:hypothetical protein
MALSPAPMSQVARSTQRVEAPLGERKLRAGGELALPGCFARGIDIEDQIPLARPIPQIPQAANRLLGPSPHERGGGKYGSKSLQTGSMDCRQKSAQSRPMGQGPPFEKRHEGLGKGMQPVKEGMNCCSACVTLSSRKAVQWG